MSSQGEYYDVQKFGDEWVAMYDPEQQLMGKSFKTEAEARAYVEADMNPTDTNQASEERIRGKLLSAYLDGRFSIEEIGKLTDKQAESVDRVIGRAIKLIRTEKLKLLAEVREQTTIFKIKAHDKKGQPHLYEAGRGVPTEVLTKLEAEL